MKKEFEILEFDRIIELLRNNALTQSAKNKISELEPIMDEGELELALRETTEARLMLDSVGAPPLVSLESVEEMLLTAHQGGCLSPEQLEYLEITLTAVRRLKDYLCRCKYLEIGLPYYEINMNDLQEVRDEIRQKIRNSAVDDYASKRLREIRSEIGHLETKMQSKAESMLKNQKECFSDSFVVKRNGRICLPVKKDYKFQINGCVIDKSSTGATLFVEPTAIAVMNDQLVMLRLDEENEERRILYVLTGEIADNIEIFRENTRVIEKLDFIFAKGKLSFDMKAVLPQIHPEREIKIINGRHPFLDIDLAVPINFEIGTDYDGVIITGPNTGGKTVSIKTVGLLSIMAQSGLHVPCESGTFTMNNAVLCDIGDGQNIAQNLSTFSSHITNVLHILKLASKDSLVIMDELGSGTDPTEGMGIATAILQELKKCGCLYLCTTHYPEIKNYAQKTERVVNARMEFDRVTLCPTYRLVLNEAGESCAFYIAKQLGMPNYMLRAANMAAYQTEGTEFRDEDENNNTPDTIRKISKKKKSVKNINLVEKFQLGDCVMVYPDKKIGIVCSKMNEKGVVQIQMKNKKIYINQKRIKLYVKADALYPPDYDFSIVFDSVEIRKARHEMNRKYCENLEIKVDGN